MFVYPKGFIWCGVLFKKGMSESFLTGSAFIERLMEKLIVLHPDKEYQGCTVDVVGADFVFGHGFGRVDIAVNDRILTAADAARFARWFRAGLRCATADSWTQHTPDQKRLSSTTSVSPGSTGESSATRRRLIAGASSACRKIPRSEASLVMPPARARVFSTVRPAV